MGRSRKEWNGGSPPGEAILRDGSAGVSPGTLALVGSSTLLATLVLIFRFSFEAATLRATIETALTLFGGVSTWFLWVRSARTRQVSDFLMFVAVLTLTVWHLVVFAGPAMLGASDYQVAVSPIAHLEVAVIFAAAALARRRRVATRREAAVLFATPVVGAAAVAAGALLLYGDMAWFGAEHRGLPTATIALTVPGVFLMVAAAVGLVRPVLRQRNLVMGLPGAAAILLAAAWSYSLLEPGLTNSSVSGRDCLCAGAFGLILLFAFGSRRQLLRAQADEVTAVERRRLIRDLHDGMAQDLAFIATYAERLVQDFGPEHPLTVAARRALAASRGFIVDLSAYDAPNAAAALGAVADELSSRHGVCVTVESHGEDVTPRTREALVRIAREAIVNAVQHGQAQHIAVSLENRDDGLTLQISDDGRGLRKEVSVDPHRGLGLQAMRERAEAIGGDLIVDERSDGGTAVRTVVF